ncbi:MAG: aspartate-semialdehyde dehydrogenase [Gammaproteobacteria bacterium]
MALGKVGFVGWRGMVGSVLMERLRSEGDFDGIATPVFFSSSQVGQRGPDTGCGTEQRGVLQDAYDLDALADMDVILTCQGGAYTQAVHGPLRERGWKGYWVDAASTLRMATSSVIVLDPVNRSVIDRALNDGVNDFIGGNCTVSLLLMALGGLLERDLVEWVSPHTYQAASGAGARMMQELIQQMGVIETSVSSLLSDPAAAILDIDQRVSQCLRADTFPIEQAGAPLAGSLLPWIDAAVEAGRTREEWKAEAEANKILARLNDPIHIDGICVRVGAMRCHSQALTLKLKRPMPPTEVEAMLADHNEWVRVVPNDRASTLAQLTPAAVTGTLSVPIGRIHSLSMGPEYMAAFTVGDQLLWGAAEPLRRMLGILGDA